MTEFEAREMKTYIAVMKYADGSGSTWEEKYTEKDNFKFGEWIEKTLKEFNSDLRPYEKARELVSWRVEEAGAPEEVGLGLNFQHFIDWANDNGVDMEHKDDWGAWWECWKDGYQAGCRDTREDI